MSAKAHQAPGENYTRVELIVDGLIELLQKLDASKIETSVELLFANIQATEAFRDPFFVFSHSVSGFRRDALDATTVKKFKRAFKYCFEHYDVSLPPVLLPQPFPLTPFFWYAIIVNLFAERLGYSPVFATYVRGSLHSIYQVLSITEERDGDFYRLGTLAFDFTLQAGYTLLEAFQMLLADPEHAEEIHNHVLTAPTKPQLH